MSTSSVPLKQHSTTTFEGIAFVSSDHYSGDEFANNKHEEKQLIDPRIIPDVTDPSSDKLKISTLKSNSLKNSEHSLTSLNQQYMKSSKIIFDESPEEAHIVIVTPKIF